MVADFNKKENSRFFNRNLLFKTVGTIFLIMIAVLIVADFKIYQKKQELEYRINNYKKQIEGIQKNSQTLKEEIANSNNKDYLEKLGYEQFDVTRPGETEYMFIKNQQKAETSATHNNPLDSFIAGFKNALYWIKNRF